jgi:hypothetical protein
MSIEKSNDLIGNLFLMICTDFQKQYCRVTVIDYFVEETVKEIAT